jgi:hypothetical protein
VSVAGAWRGAVGAVLYVGLLAGTAALVIHPPPVRRPPPAAALPAMAPLAPVPPAARQAAAPPPWLAQRLSSATLRLVRLGLRAAVLASCGDDGAAAQLLALGQRMPGAGAAAGAGRPG